MSQPNLEVPLGRELRRPSRRRRAERGAEMVEFAMVLIPMMSLVFLAVDAAWAIYAKASLQEAVREGVRYGVVTRSTTTGGVTTCTGLTAENTAITQTVVSYSGGVLSGLTPAQIASDVVITYYSPSSPGTPLTTGQLTPGNILQISVSGVPLKLLAPFFVSSSAMTLSAVAADVLEGSPCA